jgi:hypothetical protein
MPQRRYPFYAPEGIDAAAPCSVSLDILRNEKRDKGIITGSGGLDRMQIIPVEVQHKYLHASDIYRYQLNAVHLYVPRLEYYCINVLELFRVGIERKKKAYIIRLFNRAFIARIKKTGIYYIYAVAPAFKPVGQEEAPGTVV